MLARPALTLPGWCATVPAALLSATVAETSHGSTMTDRVRALLITPDDDLLTIQRRVMSTTLAGTPAATSRNAATSEPAPTGGALGATPATSPAPAGAVPAAPALPRRIRDALPAAGPGGNVQPAAGPDMLRRVLDGLHRL
jgi:hypothetical protein